MDLHFWIHFTFIIYLFILILLFSGVVDKLG